MSTPTDAQIDDALKLGSLLDTLADLFPVQIDGYPSARSQYGLPYIVLANGRVKAEGMPSVDRPLDVALSLTIGWFKSQRALGHDMIVWRRRPEITRDVVCDEVKPPSKLYLRFHTLKSSEAVELMKAAIEGVAQVKLPIFFKPETIDMLAEQIGIAAMKGCDPDGKLVSPRPDMTFARSAAFAALTCVLPHFKGVMELPRLDDGYNEDRESEG